MLASRRLRWVETLGWRMIAVDPGTLSIVTVTYESAGRIAWFLDGVVAQAPGAEVIIVDNASSDGTVEVARTHLSRPKVVNLPENVGFGRAANVGAYRSAGQWLVFANPDVQLEYVHLSNAGGEAPYGLGAARLRDGTRFPRSQVHADSTYGEDWVREVTARFLPGPLAKLVAHRRRWPPSWASGALFVVRRSEFTALGGFDPRYFLYFEDRDLGSRYRRSGMPIRRESGVAGRHLGTASSTGVSVPRRTGWEFLSWLEYLGIWRGQDATNRAAKSALGAIRAIYKLKRLYPDSERVQRKSREIEAFLDFVRNFDERLPSESNGYYPHARQALAEIECQ